MRKISNGLVCENGNQPCFFYVLVGVAVVAVVEPPYCLSSLVTLRQIRKKIFKVLPKEVERMTCWSLSVHMLHHSELQQTCGS